VVAKIKICLALDSKHSFNSRREHGWLKTCKTDLYLVYLALQKLLGKEGISENDKDL